MPVCAPTQSFSTREHNRASSRRSGSSSPATASNATHSAEPSAADDDSPAPSGRSLSMRRRAPGTLDARRAHSATVPRTNARQPSAAGGSAASKRSSSPYASAWASISPVSVASAIDRDAGLHRERQAEAGVVVGVLPEQVDAAGAPWLLLDSQQLPRRERGVGEVREDPVDPSP